MFQERELLIIPICHTNTDLCIDEDPNDPEAVAAQRSWQIIEDYIRGDFFYRVKGLNVYQDASPKLGLLNRSKLSDGEIYMKYILQLKKAYESPNLRVLINLYYRGANIIATENLRLLVLHNMFLNLFNKFPRAYSPRINSKITMMRSKEMAKTINSTLTSGNKGLAFFGANHEIRPYLDGDISVDIPKKLFEGQSSDLLDYWLGTNRQRILE